jgi:hypothetical protein
MPYYCPLFGLWGMFKNLQFFLNSILTHIVALVMILRLWISKVTPSKDINPQTNKQTNLEDQQQITFPNVLRDLPLHDFCTCFPFIMGGTSFY